MNYKDFEKHIHQEVGQHQSPIDGNALWEQIQPELNPPSNKRWWPLFGLGAFALLSLIAFGLWNSGFLTTQPESTPTTSAATIEVGKQEGIQHSGNEKESLTDPSLTEAVAITSNSEKRNTANSTSSSLTNPNKSTDHIQGQNHSAKTEEASPQGQTQTNKTTTSSNHSKLASVQPQLIKTQNKGTSNAQTRQSIEGASTKLNSTFRASSTSIPSSIDKGGFTTVPERASRQFDGQKNQAAGERKNVSPVSFLPSLPQWVLTTPLSLPEAGDWLEEGMPTTKKRGGSFNQLSYGFGAHAGLLKSVRQLSTKVDSFGNYLQLRNQTESQLESFEFGLDVYAKHKSGFYLRSGFNYTRANERFQISRSDTSIQIRQGIVEVWLNENGDTIDTKEGPIQVTVMEAFKRTTYNSFQWIDLPIVAGYTLSNDGPLKFSLEGGMHFNFLLQKKGYQFDSNGEIVDIGSEKETYKNQVGLGIFAGFGIDYELLSGWQIGIRPSFRYYPQAITKSGYVLKQSYHFVGVSAGVKRFF